MLKRLYYTVLRPLHWAITQMLNDMMEYKSTIVHLVLLGRVCYIRDVKFCNAMIILLSKLKDMTTIRG